MMNDSTHRSAAVTNGAQGARRQPDQRLSSSPAHPQPGSHEGQALIVVTLLMPILIGIAGLTIDAAMLYQQRRSLQSIADAAALTGAQRTSFNTTTPVILADGVTQATSNALINGAQPPELIVNLPPSLVAGPWIGRQDYIEVIVTREVPHTFMGLFGYTSSTIQARAVARCYKVGFGDPAVLALDPTDDEALRFDGGSSAAVRINGDVVSFGGIDPNGNASHFQITGSAMAYNGPAANVTASDGSYGMYSGVSFPPISDPVVQGLNAVPPTFSWPNNGVWPDTNGRATFHIPNQPNDHDDDGHISTHNNDTVTLTPGLYERWDFGGGTITLNPGIYNVTNRITIGSQARLSGDGVFIRIAGTGEVLTVQGGAEINLTAVPNNTWKNIVFYTPNGDIDLQGNGNRQIHGSLYAPNGEIEVAGNASGYTVYGQVIGFHVRFSGNSGAVQYTNNAENVTFAPYLVNFPK